jgi:serine phosphatase RsbU (regulator of sigma subunit)
MVTLLVALQAVLIAAALTLAARRFVAPARPPYLGPFLVIVLAVFVQTLLDGLLVFGVGTILPEGAPPGEWPEAWLWAQWGFAILRSAILLVGLFAWLRILRHARPSRRLLVAGLLFILGAGVLPGALGFLSLLVFLFLLNRVRWPDELHGARRFAAFSAVVIALLSTIVHPTIDPRDATGDVMVGSSTIPTIEWTGAMERLHRLAGPWREASRWAQRILVAQLVVVAWRLFALPIRFRGVSLKRRFGITFTLLRLVPALLAVVWAALAIHLGIGLHKLSLVRGRFEETQRRGLAAADLVLENAERNGALPSARTLDSLVARARPWMELPAETPVHAIVRGGSETIDAATGSTPAALLERAVVPPAPGDSSVGLIEAGGTLYLRSLRVGAAPAEPAGSVEVLVPLALPYLEAVARRVGTEIELRAIPGLYVGDTVVSTGADSLWASAEVRLRTDAFADTTAGGLLGRELYVGRTLLRSGDWNRPPPGGQSGALYLTLRASPALLYPSLVAEPYFFSSNVFVVIAFLGILFLAGAVDFLAVRSGRSIMGGVVEDVRDLSDAAHRLGAGELDHRVSVRDRKELGQLAAAFNDMAEDLKQHQERLLARERLLADLAVARQIQQRLLPVGTPEVSGLDIAGASHPSQEVGGDLFTFAPSADGRLAVALGDVSGKSVPAALLMSNVAASLRMESRLGSAVHESLARINEVLGEQVEPGRFVTLFYGVVDARALSLRYASAGHLPPLLVTAEGKARWLDESGLPLAVMPASTYQEVEEPFGRGDVLVVYSDGVTEAEAPDGDGGGPQDEGDVYDPDQFGSERLMSAVLDLRTARAAEIERGIMEKVREFEGGRPSSDDLTLVVIKRVD